MRRLLAAIVAAGALVAVATLGVAGAGPATNTRKPLRVQLTISQDKVPDLEWMKEVGAVTRTTELYNSALTLFKWALQERIAGREIASYDGKAFRILTMPMLDAAAEHGKRSATPR